MIEWVTAFHVSLSQCHSHLGFIANTSIYDSCSVLGYQEEEHQALSIDESSTALISEFMSFVDSRGLFGAFLIEIIND